MGLGTRIWASKLGGRADERTEEEKEKISHMCETIGYRPLRERCPKKKEDKEVKEGDRSMAKGYNSERDQKEERDDQDKQEQI